MASNEIWVVVEHQQNKVRKVTYEMLSVGKSLAEKQGKKLCALLIGDNVASLTTNLKAYGADGVYLAQNSQLKDYTTDAYTWLVANLIKEHTPYLVLLGHTSIGKDLAPRVAERVGAGLASDVIGIQLTEGQLTFTRAIYAGKAYATLEIQGETAMATVRPNVFDLEEQQGQGEVVEVKVDLPDNTLRTVIKEILKSAGERVSLTEANVIVSGGRGMKGPENYNILEELADELGGAVGASRAAVDAGWRAHEFQVGQTGKTVSPNVYIACGISGSIQHLAGMSSSKYIIAINKDPDANIFSVADLGVVGDLFKIVPLLTEEVRAIKGAGNAQSKGA